MPPESPLLEALHHDDRALLLGRAVRRRLARGQSLYLTGDPTPRAHLLVEGVVKMVARNGEGHATILCLARPGEILGEVAALDGAPQPLDVVAATPCEVLGVDAGVLLDVLHRSPAAMLEVATTLARRFRWLGDTALERSTATVPARLAGRLLDLAELLGRTEGGAIEIELPLAQEDLGRLAGMCRESACKALRSFRSRGLLDYRGRRLRIMRPDALESIRCTGRAET